MKPEELFGKDYQDFEEVDPYNPTNKVAGFISRQSTGYYGALIIIAVNGKLVEPQLIMGTPKMHYPFTSDKQIGTRKFTFPMAKNVEVYEKLDGTNILAFRYNDGGKEYISYKTRLRPFVNAGSKWGDFYSMWNEAAEPAFGEIKLLMENMNCNLSFELYGLRNAHLVLYDTPIDFALLFGVTGTGRILSPTMLAAPVELKPLKPMKTITDNLMEEYQALQKELDKNLKKVDENNYQGVEGTVWYLTTGDGKCTQFKCKPETIENIHFAAGAGITKGIVLATCWNALENVENITIDFVKELLREEFDDRLVEISHNMIEKCISIVNSELTFRDAVLSAYGEVAGTILLQKADVMRELSGKFDRSKMRKVYSTIINWG